MAYSETRIVIGGLAHVPILNLITNIIKGKFAIKTKEVKDTPIKEKPIKNIRVKDILVKEEKAKAIKNLSKQLDGIEKKLMRFMKS
tara:strand:+ start:493 stop:750 length:258 start_codon:yes stop_codon:yes gene_type:complete